MIRENIAVKKRARATFESGPARATLISSFSGFFKLRLSRFTGFAHQNHIKTININPRGSRCLKGLKDILH